MLVEAADRTLRILEAFPPERDVSLGEVADAVALPKSSVHRLLAVLVARGFVEQDPVTRRYSLGIRLFELGATAIRARGLHGIAHGALHDLSVETKATSHLAVQSENMAVYVDKIDGPGVMAMSSRIGGRAPLHATSIGKVLVAWAGQDLEDRLARSRLGRFTSTTIGSGSDLRAELAAVRQRGYALDLEEYEEGLYCVAAPVFGQTGVVQAAIGIAASRRLFESRRPADLVGPVVRAAQRLCGGFGYPPRGPRPTSALPAGYTRIA
jgi:DNA-binding IclR family transcriptional regulator